MFQLHFIYDGDPTNYKRGKNWIFSCYGCPSNPMHLELTTSISHCLKEVMDLEVGLYSNTNTQVLVQFYTSDSTSWRGILLFQTCQLSNHLVQKINFIKY